MENQKRGVWLEDVMREEQKIANAKKTGDMINKWTQKYPTINFNDLEKQRDNCFTDDSCIHYKTAQNVIYSWDYRLSEWMQNDVKHQQSLLKLFNK